MTGSHLFIQWITLKLQGEVGTGQLIKRTFSSSYSHALHQQQCRTWWRFWPSIVKTCASLIFPGAFWSKARPGLSILLAFGVLPFKIDCFLLSRIEPITLWEAQVSEALHTEAQPTTMCTPPPTQPPPPPYPFQQSGDYLRPRAVLATNAWLLLHCWGAPSWPRAWTWRADVCLQNAMQNITLVLKTYYPKRDKKCQFKDKARKIWSSGCKIFTFFHSWVLSISQTFSNNNNNNNSSKNNNNRAAKSGKKRQSQTCA